MQSQVSTASQTEPNCHEPFLCLGDSVVVILGGRCVVLDCTVTHPCAPSYLQDASQTAGFAVAQMEWAKYIDFEQLGIGAGHNFLPMVMDPFGLLEREPFRVSFD